LAISPPSLSCTFPTTFLNLAQVCGQPDLTCSLLYPDGNTASGAEFEIDQVGEYELQIFDSNSGCNWLVEPFTVSGDFETPDLEVAGDVDLPCANMAASVEAQSSYGNVVYVWTGTNFPLPNNPAQQLAPGIYTVTAELPNGCETSQAVIVSSPPPLVIDWIGTADCDGFLEPFVLLSGGTPPYAFSLSPAPPIAPNTAFSISVEDGNACMWQQDFFNPEMLITIVVQHSDETVAGENDGSATVEVVGGIGTFEFLWSNGETAQSIANLPPGDYTVTVTNQENGCTATATVSIQAGVSALAEMPGIVSLLLLPNPTSGRFELAIELVQMADLQVELTDVTGRVLQKTSIEKARGKTWLFDIADQAAGLFICKIYVDGQAIARKVVKVD
jgi:hypothetical protein